MAERPDPPRAAGLGDPIPRIRAVAGDGAACTASMASPPRMAEEKKTDADAAPEATERPIMRQRKRDRLAAQSRARRPRARKTVD